MQNNSNILQFSNEITKLPLFKELESINSFTKKVKLRARKSSSGKYILYLELFRNAKRERYYLGLSYLGLKNTKKRDQETLKTAIAILHQKDNEYFSNKHGFKFENKSLETGFIEYFESLVEKRAKPDKSWSHTLVHLKIFFKHDIPLYEFIEKHCEQFKNYLLNNERINSNNTAHVYFAKIKAALNMAIKDKIIDKNPAQFIHINKEESQREFLTIDEIRKLNNTPCKSEQTKRAFLFSCFTGLRISDIKKLTWTEIQDGYLAYKQKKTKRHERMKLSKSALGILDQQEKFKSMLDNDKIFKLIADNHSGIQIRKWAKEAGINKRITWHVGRHTFATLSLTYGNDIYMISKLLGHKDVKVTQLYTKLIDSKKDEAIDKLPNLFE